MALHVPHPCTFKKTIIVGEKKPLVRYTKESTCARVSRMGWDAGIAQRQLRKELASRDSVVQRCCTIRVEGVDSRSTPNQKFYNLFVAKAVQIKIRPTGIVSHSVQHRLGATSSTQSTGVKYRVVLNSGTAKAGLRTSTHSAMECLPASFHRPC